MTITLERLKHAEINLLRELRNANREAFFDTGYVTKEMQEDWFCRYGLDVRLQFYTIWLNGVTPVGFLSVRQLGEEGPCLVCEVGNLLLAPAHRGRGIMHAAMTEVRRLYSPLTFWIAHVKPGNKASLNLFKRQQFAKLTSKRSRNAHPNSSLHRRSISQHRPGPDLP